jgi:hypothetical protein
MISEGNDEDGDDEAPGGNNWGNEEVGGTGSTAVVVWFIKYRVCIY